MKEFTGLAYQLHNSPLPACIPTKFEVSDKIQDDGVSDHRLIWAIRKCIVDANADTCFEERKFVEAILASYEDLWVEIPALRGFAFTNRSDTTVMWSCFGEFHLTITTKSNKLTHLRLEHIHEHIPE